MSAEVLLMNKHGIALAADSAITIGNKKKIFNCGDKLFMLSKYHPIGMMIYNKTDFMGIPLEILIKNFRKKLDSTWPKGIDEIKDDFINSLKHLDQSNYDINLFITYAINDAINLLEKLIRDLLPKAISYYNHNPVSIDDFGSYVNNELEEGYNSYIQENNIDYYQNFTDNVEELKKEFLTRYKENVRSIAKSRSDDNYIPHIFNDAENIIIALCIDWFFRQYGRKPYYAGIVIAGYGEDKLYPSCTSFKLYGIYHDEFIITDDEYFNINNDNIQYIKPFAQEDVMNCYINGIDDRFLSCIRDAIMSYIPPKDEKEISDIIKQDIIEKVKNAIGEKSYKDFYNPFVQLINSMPKSELAMIAENLVNLTSFRRKVAYDELLSETVGGPIDVAVISRGDGFVWIKRKFYFEKEYNHHYFARYYMKERIEGDGNGGSKEQ
jgi:hypothetical protein